MIAEPLTKVEQEKKLRLEAEQKPRPWIICFCSLNAPHFMNKNLELLYVIDKVHYQFIVSHINVEKLVVLGLTVPLLQSIKQCWIFSAEITASGILLRRSLP